MSKGACLSVKVVDAEANAFAALFDSGFLDIFDGVQPSSCDTAITSQVMLASLGFNAKAFAAAVDGKVVANPMTACSSASNTGNAAWARCYAHDHTTALMDIKVGTNLGVGVTLGSVAIQARARVWLDDFKHSVPTVVS